MKKHYVVMLLLLVGMAGCGKRKKTKLSGAQKETFTEVDIPTTDPKDKDANIHSFFDGDLGEFALADDVANPTKTTAHDEYSFVQDARQNSKDAFKIVYFNFDEASIRDDQEATLAFDIERAKDMLAQNPQATIVIDGHACHSAGSHVYNLALSEKRAKVLADRFAAAGVPAENMKIVGRGMEMPAIIDGKAVEGDRAQQWPNRRDEMRIIYS